MYEEIPTTFSELYRFNLKNFQISGGYQKQFIDIINGNETNVIYWLIRLKFTL